MREAVFAMPTTKHPAEAVVKKAFELGYENCGIIKIEDTLDYADKLRERIEYTPWDTAKLSQLYRFTRLRETHPWAKSVIVCVRRYGKYAIPPNLDGLIAKYYLVDGRKNVDSPDYKASAAFEKYLHSLGLKTEAERDFGITALRWAAYKAGLGVIRRNNFFYTASGSWVYLEAWLTGAEMERKQESALKPCPSNCDRCIAACPTKSLCKPYVMSRASCVSCLTTWDDDDLSREPDNYRMGRWVFGCDACQDVCPYNAGKWDSTEEFPGLYVLAERIGLEEIVRMDYDYLINVMQPKFWYIGKDRIWKWKVNALGAMRNSGDRRFDKVIAEAVNDPNEHVRQMAAWVLAGIKRERESQY